MIPEGVTNDVILHEIIKSLLKMFHIRLFGPELILMDDQHEESDYCIFKGIRMLCDERL